MRVLVTGAAGFLGRWLVERLAREGHSVRGLVRKTPTPELAPSKNIEFLEGDVTQPTSLARAVEGTEVVFHLAGIRRGATRAPFFEVNALGTRNVLEAMVAARCRRFVLCGSLAAMGPSTRERPHLESDPLLPTEWYGESKAEAERIAWEYGDRLELTVVRPPRILGPGDRENLVFFKMVKKGVKLSLSGGPRPLSMVDVGDVVDFLLLLATHAGAVGEAFFVSSFTTSLEEIEGLAALYLGVKPRLLQLSPLGLRMLAAAADGVSRATGHNLPLSRKLARQLLAPAWTCSTTKAEQRLGFFSRHTLEASIARSARWYLDEGWL